MSLKKFAVLGHPIGHTLSPAMHNAAFKELGFDAEYVALDVEPEKLITQLPSLRDEGFCGLNLTIPLKETAFNGLENLDQSAQMLGAVNTVEFANDGNIIGHNTDGYGFLTAIKEAFDVDVKNLSMFVLGCGGAGRAVILTSAKRGTKQITIADVEEDRARKVAGEVLQIAPDSEIRIIENSPEAWEEASRNAELVVQATPVGMKQDDKPLLSSAAFCEGQMAFDLIYMYPETSFMKPAIEAGTKTSNGLGMLLHQGAKAFNIWTGQEPAVNAMRQALETEVYK